MEVTSERDPMTDAVIVNGTRITYFDWRAATAPLLSALPPSEAGRAAWRALVAEAIKEK